MVSRLWQVCEPLVDGVVVAASTSEPSAESSGLPAAEGAEGVALLGGEDGEWIHRGAAGAVEERVWPGLAAQLPAGDLADGAGEEADAGPGAARRGRADGELAVDGAAGRAGDVVGRAECLGD